MPQHLEQRLVGSSLRGCTVSLATSLQMTAMNIPLTHRHPVLSNRLVVHLMSTEVAHSTPMTKSFSSTGVVQSKSRISTPRTTERLSETAATALTTVVLVTLSLTTSSLSTVAFSVVSTPTTVTLVSSATLARTMARLVIATRASMEAVSQTRLGVVRTGPTAKLQTRAPTASGLWR